MAKVTGLSLERSGGTQQRRLHLREISADGDAPLETVGLDLRSARQRKGEDLATVSRALKIRKDHLEALEESNLEGLPGRAYAIGFLRSYADYLGLDSNSCVERFKAEIAGRGDGDEPSLLPSVEHERKWPQGAIVFVVLLVAVVAYAAYYLLSSPAQTASTVTAVPERLAAEAAGPAASVPAPAIEPAPALEPAPPPPAPPTAAELAASLPPGRAYGTRNSDSRVTLRVHMPIRVTVQGADNMIFISRELSPGDRYQTPNLVGLRISTPDSGAVEVILDGTSLGFLGASGANAEDLSLDPQDLVDRARQNPG